MKKNVLVLLFAVLLVVSPCYGYNLAVSKGDKSGNTVQLFFSDNEPWNLAGSETSNAADQVIAFAKSKEMKITRSKGNVEGEIRAHAIAWIVNLGDSRTHANPMDLTMTDNSWLWHLMD